MLTGRGEVLCLIMPKKVVSAKKPLSVKKAVVYENGLEEFFVKSLPAFPDGLKEFLVSVGPWIDLVLVILSLPAILAVFGWGGTMMSYSYMMGGVRYGLGLSLSWWISIVALGLNVLALPGLFKRELMSWRLLFYSVWVSALGSLLNGAIISLIIGTGLSLYVLYQIKNYYK